MNISYSPSTRGFYPSDLLEAYEQAGSLPDDLIEVPRDIYDALMAAQTNGKSIVPGADGKPVVVDHVVSPEDGRALNAKIRDGLLSEAAIRIAPLQDASDLAEILSAEQDALLAWKRYRVLVSRVDTGVYPANWPDKPLSIG